MFNLLPQLKTLGYIPDTILDIGAHHGNWTTSMMSIYPDAKYYLFEGINYKELEKFKFNSNVTVKNVLLNDKIDIVDWWEEKNTGDSFYKEKSKFFVNTKAIKRVTVDLDTLIDTDNILKDTGNTLIKIDCQGAEIPILKGSKKILPHTDFIILEMPLFGEYNEGVPTFTDHIEFMDKIGFSTFDMVESHIINGFTQQVDMLFINTTSKFYTEFTRKQNSSDFKVIDYGEKVYHIEFVKQHTVIEGDFIPVIMLIDNLVADLKIMQDYNFIPFNIIKNSNTLGVAELHMIFIKNTHKFNTIVQEKLFT
tara:strand:- start:226 stop:1149 length:924 start_codon:yes stop_codon:yes gene_type:complete